MCALMGLMLLVLIYTVAPTIINAVIKATHQWQALLRQGASMDTLKFSLALEGEGMDPDQVAIIAHEMYRIYAHSVLGGVYKPVDYGDFETLQLKAKLARGNKEAMTNALRAMNADDAEQEKHWRGEMERIEAERRQRGSSSTDPKHDSRHRLTHSTEL
jgi:hypothetical protein